MGCAGDGCAYPPRIASVLVAPLEGTSLRRALRCWIPSGPVDVRQARHRDALGFLAILGASVVVLHERANLRTLVGSSMVVGGLIVIVTLGPPSTLST
jgi:hypothetical protein